MQIGVLDAVADLVLLENQLLLVRDLLVDRRSLKPRQC